jgi:phospholipid/cholesterol/gamma-HCH transport system substrate-binding protein
MLVGSASGFITSGSHVVDTVYGQRRQISQLVDQLGDVAAGVGERGDDIQALAKGGVITFRALADQDDDLRALARVLPSTLRQVGTTTRKVALTTDRAAPVLAELATTIHAAKPAAQAPAATELNGVVHDLGSASPRLEKTLTSLRRFSGPTSTALPKLHKVLCQVNPIVSYAKPYVADVVAVLAHLGSASNAYDAIGHTIRLAATVNQNSLVGLPTKAADAVNTLLNAGVLSKSTGITYNPYPKPGQANARLEDLPMATGPDKLKEQTGYEYPRIKADC